MESEVLMRVALKLFLFFIGMALSMLGIMVALHSQQHTILGVLILFSGMTTIWGSLPSYD
jgi:hypothetical protein